MKKSNPNECARSKCQRRRLPNSDLCDVCINKCSRCGCKLNYATNVDQLFVHPQARHPLEGDDPRFRKCERCRTQAAIARFDRAMSETDQQRQARITSLKKYKQAHPEKVAAQNKRYNKKIRARVFERYGSCVCCGENNPRLLTLGHVHEDGAKHRAGIGAGGLNILLCAIRENFPDYLQSECYNCNLGRKLNRGVCPHEEVARQVLRASCSRS